MSKKTRKHCKVCRDDDREEIEGSTRNLSKTADDWDKERDWPSGTVSRHMRNHAGEYEEKSNPRCKLCIDGGREMYEHGLAEGTLASKDLASALGTTTDQIALHMRSHLQPLVQKSAAQMIARKELDEIELLSKNIQKLDVKLDELFEQDNIESRTIDSLTKLAKEVRESLKYLMEFKGKLVHKRQDTIVIAQMQIVKEVLAQQHPSVWIDVKSKMQERLQ
jgi:hypothetical protein